MGIEKLEIGNRTYRFVRRMLGILMMALAVTWFILFFDEDKVFDLVLAFVFVVTGMFHLTQGFGLEKTWLGTDGTRLYIKWYNMLKPRVLDPSEIESVNLGRYNVKVNFKGKRPIKLKIDHMTLAEKAEIYDFMIVNCNKLGVQLFKHPETIKIL